MIMAPTSRDEIERSVVIQEPTPSILAIGQSIIVTTRVRLRSGSAYQGVRSAESVWFASTEEEIGNDLLSRSEPSARPNAPCIRPLLL
jgi:hypothetical protein